jgi:hypothetical protein
MLNLTSKKWLWTGRVLTTLGAAFMLFDAIIHISQIPAVVASFTQMGYPLGIIVPLSIVELISIVLYIIPSTSVWGAILLTGYLGGAVDANVRAGNPFFSLIMFPVYIAIVLWAGLYLRNEKLRAVLCGK